MLDTLHAQIRTLVFATLSDRLLPLLDPSRLDGPGALMELERSVLARTTELAGWLIGLVLCARIEDVAFQATASHALKAGRDIPLRYQCLQEYQVRTLAGTTVRLRTRYFSPKGRRRGRPSSDGCRGKAGAGSYPALAVLGIEDGMTPTLRSTIAKEVVTGPSFEAAQQRLAERGVDLEVRTVRRVANRFGQQSLQWRTEHLASDQSLLSGPSGALKGKRLAIEIDGGRSRTREAKTGAIPRGKKRQGFHAPWREPKVLTITLMDSEGNLDRSTPPLYDGTVGDADELVGILAGHLRGSDIAAAAQVVLVGDGAPWMWARVPVLLHELGVPADRIVEVVDFYHAVEHLSEVAEGKANWSARKRKRWFNQSKRQLKDGRIDELIDRIALLRRGRKAAIFRRALEYFGTHMQRMRYRWFKHHKIPLGSGIVESAIRRIVNLRLKGAGIFWKLDNLNGMLHLRCHLLAGRWAALEKGVILSRTPCAGGPSI